jgi:thiol-disulfide isomerase/thioredoxin
MKPIRESRPGLARRPFTLPCLFHHSLHPAIVPRASLPHNGCGNHFIMPKYFMLLLGGLASIIGLVIGMSAARSRHFVSPKALTASHSGASATPAARTPGSPAHKNPDDDSRVIRFASNPQLVPPFLVNDLDGNPVSTAEWDGKIVILNFWATWCPPCREEIPELIALANRYKDRLQIIGASVDDSSPEEVKQFAKAMGMNYPIVMASREMVSEYGGVPALPTSFVINKDGRVVQKHVGLFPTEVYEGEIRALLGLPVEATIETFEDTGQIFLKNASLATELPGVNLKSLTPAQKKEALKELNSRTCDCGCALTLAQCRMNDTSCPISLKLAQRIVKEASSPVPSPAPAPTSQ